MSAILRSSITPTSNVAPVTDLRVAGILRWSCAVFVIFFGSWTVLSNLVVLSGGRFNHLLKLAPLVLVACPIAVYLLRGPAGIVPTEPPPGYEPRAEAPAHRTALTRLLVAGAIAAVFASGGQDSIFWGLAVAAILLAPLSTTLFLMGTLILILGVAHSFPVLRFKGKGIPLPSSFLYIMGTVLTFLLGYSLFSPLDVRALLIGGYFALIITAGHLVQEVQDFAGDRATEISTNAVRFGPRLIFLESFSLFTLSFAYLFGLASSGLIPDGLKGLLAFYPVYVFLAWRTFRAGLTYEPVHRFRGQYRLLFAALVCIMAALTVLV